LATYRGTIRNGRGNASRYQLRNGAEVQQELAALLGYTPHPGTANVRLGGPFDFTQPYLDGALSGAVGPVRFYPVRITVGRRKASGHVIRLHGSTLPADLVGVLAPVCLRHYGITVRLEHGE
jgi:CTP-dependent riboflavin kinase